MNLKEVVNAINKQWEQKFDKIRAEIVELDNKVCQQFLIEDVDKEIHHAYQDCLNILDKYKV